MEKIKKIIIETDNYATIYDKCIFAKETNEMIAIVGESGWGKSTCLEHIATLDTDIYIIIARPGVRPKIFYNQIINAIDDQSREPFMSVFDLINFAAHLFTRDSRKKLLIIDECGKFTTYEWEHLHWFRDLTKETTGIILAGPSSFEEDILKWKRQNRRGVQEAYSRINIWVHLDPPTKEDVKEIIYAYGIKDRKFISKYENLKDLRDLVESKIEHYINGDFDYLYQDELVKEDLKA